MMTECKELNTFSAPFIFSYNKIDHIFLKKIIIKEKKVLKLCLE